MISIQVRVTEKLIEKIDELIEDGTYSSRSEAIRDAIRRHLENSSYNAYKERS